MWRTAVVVLILLDVLPAQGAEPLHAGPPEANEAALPALLKWAGPKGRTTVFDRGCRPIRVSRAGEQLIGEVRRTVKDGLVSWDNVTFGLDATIAGHHSRSKDGRWATRGSFWEDLGRLSEVTEDAAWYFDENPLIFRSRRACVRYRKGHPVKLDELPW